MTNKKSTKRALLTSVLCLILCFSMLVGTTFAWFTDEVNSGVNQIAAGNLDVKLYHTNKVDTDEAVSTTTPLFDDVTLWEPGAVAYETFTVKNVGTLALNYQMLISFTNENTLEGHGLSEVLKLGLIEGAVPANSTRSDVLDMVKDGNWYEITDSELLGSLLPEAEAELTLVIYWAPNEDAIDNLYNVNNGQVADDGEDYLYIDLGIKLVATQMVHEEDSFNNKYDLIATPALAPNASVTTEEPQMVTATLGMGGSDTLDLDLDCYFVFETTESADEAAAGAYADWHADFVVSVDKDVEPMGIVLAGYYAAYCEGYNDGNWVALADASNTIAAGQEIRLLELMLGGGSMSYEELCQWVPVFECGAVDYTGNNSGTTLTVELRLYEMEKSAASTKAETGKYITIGTYTHTFTKEVSNVEGLKNAMSSGSHATLTEDITSSEIIDMAGGTLDGNGNTITSTYSGTGTNAAIQTTGGTIENLTIENGTVDAAKGLRAVYVTNPTGDIYIDNCVIDATYCININSNSNAYGLYVSNSTLNGWTSYGSAKEAVFTNCTFGKGTTGYANLRPYADTTLEDCSFSDDFEITRDKSLSNEITITLNNCTVNGVKVTAENFVELLASAEGEYSLQGCNLITVIVDGVEVSL